MAKTPKETREPTPREEQSSLPDNNRRNSTPSPDQRDLESEEATQRNTGEVAGRKDGLTDREADPKPAGPATANPPSGR